MNDTKNEKPAPNFLAAQPIAESRPEIKQTVPKKKRVVFYFIVLFAALILGWVGCRFILQIKPASPTAYGSLILQPKKTGFIQAVKNFLFSQPGWLEGQQEDRVNILLLGVGGAGHDGPYLSDTNIVVSVKPSTGEVAMISVPRDLGVQIENLGIYKINFADAYGEGKYPGQGGEYARQVFSRTFNLDIPYYVRVDFKAFEEIIDAVGGVTIEVKNSFTDQSYPGPNYSYQTISFTAGRQEMTGERALQFVRSRHGSNGESSDFARAKRQQQMLSALRDKVLSTDTLLNPGRIQKIWQSLSANLATNLEAGQIAYLFSILKNIDTSRIKNFVLDNSPTGCLTAYIAPSGAYILAPKTGSFDEINAAVKKIFDPDFQPAAFFASAKPGATSGSGTTVPSPSGFTPAATAKVEIFNGTWRAGLASRYQDKLADEGFSVINIGNSPLRPFSETVLYLTNPGIASSAVERLNKIVPGKIETRLPEWLTPEYDNPKTMENEMGPKYSEGADILIILGTDAKD